MKGRVAIFALVFALLTPSIMALMPAQALASPDSYIAQAVVGPSLKSPAPAAPPKVEADKRITITMFCIFIAITLELFIGHRNEPQLRGLTTAASSAITGVQNGWAMAGDFMSAASFLGVSDSSRSLDGREYLRP